VFSTHAKSAGTLVTAAAVSHKHDRAFALAVDAGIADQYGDWLRMIIDMYLDG
jgi:hypothetical protein